MNRENEPGRLTFLSLILLCVIVLPGTFVLAQEPTDDPVRIVGVESGGPDQLNIIGENFDKGDPNQPSVWINDDMIDPAHVISWGPALIEVTFDFAGYTDTMNTLMVQVEIAGETTPDGETELSIEYAEFCLGVDAQNMPYECDFEANTTLAPMEKVVMWKVANDPAEETWVEYGYKFGPTKVENRQNKFGDPAYYQLLEDYDVPVWRYLHEWDDNPWGIALLDRCSLAMPDLWQRLTELDGEWSEDEPEIGGGYLSISEGVLNIKRGYRWDGPTLDAINTRIMAKPAALMRATIVHDAIYDLMRLHDIEHDWVRVIGTDAFYNRKLADCMFFMIATQDHYKRSKARSDFDFIRLGGAAKTKQDLPFWKFHATADAGEYEPVDCADPAGTAVMLDGSGSYQAVLWDWAVENRITGDVSYFTGETAEATLEPGVYDVTLTVDDGNDGEESELYKDTEAAVITLNPDTEAPVFLLADDVAVPNDPGRCSAIVDFEVIAVDDCGPPDIICTNVSSGDPVPVGAPTEFPVGTTHVECIASDIGGNETVEEILVTVTDVEPPVINGIPGPLAMWPPNHKYWTFTTADFVISVADNCTALTVDDVMVRMVASDEPENGQGDGNTLQDIVIAADGKSVRLRSEKQGGGNGRVYTVFLELADAAGNVTVKPFEVHAVDDRHGQAINDGIAYSVQFDAPTEEEPEERQPRRRGFSRRFFD